MPYDITTTTLPSGIKALKVDGTGVISKEDADVLMRAIGMGGPYYRWPMLVTTQRMQQMSPEARSIFSAPAQPGMDLPWCAAVVTSALIRVTANFLFRVSKSSRKVKMFTDEREAVAWLDERAREDAAKAPAAT